MKARVKHVPKKDLLATVRGWITWAAGIAATISGLGFGGHHIRKHWHDHHIDSAVTAARK